MPVSTVTKRNVYNEVQMLRRAKLVIILNEKIRHLSKPFSQIRFSLLLVPRNTGRDRFSVEVFTLVSTSDRQIS